MLSLGDSVAPLKLKGLLSTLKGSLSTYKRTLSTYSSHQMKCYLHKRHKCIACCLTLAESPVESIPNATEMPIASYFSGTELLGSTGTSVLQKLVDTQLIAVSVVKYDWTASFIGMKLIIVCVCV